MALVAETMTDFAIMTIDTRGPDRDLEPRAPQRLRLTRPRRPSASRSTSSSPPRTGPPACPRERAARGRRERARARRALACGARTAALFFASGVTAPLRSGVARLRQDLPRPDRTWPPRQELDARRLTAAEAGVDEAIQESELKRRVPGGDVARAEAPAQPDQRQRRAADAPARGAGACRRCSARRRRSGARSQSQARIIDDLLDLSRTNTGKLAVNRVPLAARRGDPAVHGLGAGRGAQQGRAAVRRGPGRAGPDRRRSGADRADRLEPAQQRDQVHPHGGSVTVRLSHDDDEALLEVVDTGRGIAPAFLPQVFEMFSQADAATTPRRGRPGHRPGAGEEPGRAARRPGRGRVGRARPGHDASGLAAAAPAHRLRRRSTRPSEVKPAPNHRRLARAAGRRHRRHARDLRLPARARGRAGHAGEQRRGGAGSWPRPRTSTW